LVPPDGARVRVSPVALDRERERGLVRLAVGEPEEALERDRDRDRALESLPREDEPEAESALSPPSAMSALRSRSASESNWSRRSWMSWRMRSIMGLARPRLVRGSGIVQSRTVSRPAEPTRPIASLR
jgi:hypothetical protein